VPGLGTNRQMTLSIFRVDASSRLPSVADMTIPVSGFRTERSDRDRTAVATRRQTETLIDVLWGSVEATPHAAALHTDEATLTYTELWANAERLAKRLRRKGIGPGDRVGIHVPSGTTDLYVAILGVLRAGAAYVPVDAEDPVERVTTVFNVADVCAVVTDGLDVDVRRSGAGVEREPVPGDDAWIIFTSGSTGEPKGVAISHASASAFVRAEQRLWSLGPQDRVLAGLSVAFDASCEEMWLAWANSGALVPAPRRIVRSGADLGAWLGERGVTVVSTVPTLAALWSDDVIGRLRLLILGGEALPQPLADRLAEQCETWNTYGPTEATVVTTATRVTPGRPLTIGHPLAGWLTAVVDAEGRPVPDGEPGELVIGGVGLGRYLDPVLDRERYAANAHLGWDRAYRSGDIVTATRDGYAFGGRRDDQIKFGGRRIELGEVDAALASHPGVAAGAAAMRTTDAGNAVLVGYVVPVHGASVDPVEVRSHVAGLLSGGLAPLVVVLGEMPIRVSGKVDRAGLPWPPPSEHDAGGLSSTQAWVADRWREQLGPVALDERSDFFESGGTSVAAAKLVSVVRASYPQVAVADVYHHRTLEEFATHLDGIAGQQVALSAEHEPVSATRRRSSAAVLTALVGVLMTTMAVPWLLGIFAYDDLVGGAKLPSAPWWMLVPVWLLLASTPGRALIVMGVRRLLLPRLRPGRYSRHSSVGWRLWFVERLADLFHVEHFGGTPWAGRIARWSGFEVHRSARLATVPPPSGLVRIGADVTVEGEVDMHGWYVEGSEIVVAEVVIEDGARIGQRASLTPGVRIGAGAEIEPGAVVVCDVPAGERWAGAPASRVGTAGELWPPDLPPAATSPRHRLVFAFGLAMRTLLPFVAILPMAGLIDLLLGGSLVGDLSNMLLAAPVLALGYVVTDAVLLALSMRIAGRWLRPGWHRDDSAVACALWFTGGLFGDAVASLFPLFSSSFTRAWLRLAGIRVGAGTEISTASGLNRLVSFGELCFSTDDVCFAVARARGGWLEVAPVVIGDRTFLGNGAIIRGGSRIGDDCLIGLQTIAPRQVPDGTSWFGTPALELPRVRVTSDPRRTLRPSRRLRAARRFFDALRILVPTTIAIALASACYVGLMAIGAGWGRVAMVVLAPVVLAAAGLVACGVTIALKWLLIGRYDTRSHPFFSTFVWRDELINSCQELLSGSWLLASATGTPLLNVYLRLLGARIGRDAYIDTLAITEYDQVDVGESASVNRDACIQTHLFQDRVMQIGPSRLGCHSSMGPRTAVLPDTTVGDHTHLGTRSVLLRGESLPDNTRWIGVPVVGHTVASAVPDND